MLIIVWHKITHPFQNFNGASVEVWEWIRNCITHIVMDIITYPCWDLNQTMSVNHVSKRNPCMIWMIASQWINDCHLCEESVSCSIYVSLHIKDFYWRIYELPKYTYRTNVELRNDLNRLTKLDKWRNMVQNVSVFVINYIHVRQPLWITSENQTQIAYNAVVGHRHISFYTYNKHSIYVKALLLA